jgi:Starch synthase catalytic domain
MQAHYRDYDKMTYARSVAVIHNMAHQGRGPMAELAPLEIPQQYEDLVRKNRCATERRIPVDQEEMVTCCICCICSIA